MKSLEELCRTAAQAKYEVQKLCAEEKNRALEAVAEALIANQETILKANEIDISNGQEKGMHSGLLDRLRLSTDRIKAMAQGLLQIAALPDPVGEVLERFERPNGLRIEKRRVPLGVIGIIYESRPNVTADAFGLCFKSGNAVILKGGSDAIHSNRAIAEVIRDALAGSGADKEAIQLIKTADRSVTREFMRMKQYVDVLIPRGGAGLIRSVVENSTIPVIETGTGNCHIYVDEYADLTKAIPIILNAKTQRIGVCNACESLVLKGLNGFDGNHIVKILFSVILLRGRLAVDRLAGSLIPPDFHILFFQRLCQFWKKRFPNRLMDDQGLAGVAHPDSLCFCV